MQEEVLTYVESQDQIGSIKNVLQDVILVVSPDYFRSNEFRSLLKQKAVADMNDLV